jgi:hypothetical protein
MTSNVIKLHSQQPTIVTKAALAQHLKCSTRSVENKMAEGMPSLDLDRFGRRRFNLESVEAWLRGPRPSLESRVAAIEKRLGMG